MEDNNLNNNANELNNANDPAGTQDTQTPSLETLMAELAKYKVENDRLNKTASANAQEASKYKKQFMANQTEAERIAMEKAEEDAKFKDEFEKLKRENAVNLFTKKFLGLGYDEVTATKAAEAQLDNDTDTLFELQRKYFEGKEKAIKSELLKGMPIPPNGNEDGVVHVTQEQFDKMSYLQKVELRKTSPKEYERLAKK